MDELVTAYARWRDAEFATHELQAALFTPHGGLAWTPSASDLRALACARRGASLLLRDYLDCVRRQAQQLRMG